LLDAHHVFLKDLAEVMSKTTGRVISAAFNQHVRQRCHRFGSAGSASALIQGRA
jgi:hypothetical protein